MKRCLDYCVTDQIGIGTLDLAIVNRQERQFRKNANPIQSQLRTVKQSPCSKKFTLDGDCAIKSDHGLNVVSIAILEFVTSGEI